MTDTETLTVQADVETAGVEQTLADLREIRDCLDQIDAAMDRLENRDVTLDISVGGGDDE